MASLLRATPPVGTVLLPTPGPAPPIPRTPFSVIPVRDPPRQNGPAARPSPS
jgi:hypothetical protein